MTIEQKPDGTLVRNGLPQATLAALNSPRWKIDDHIRKQLREYEEMRAKAKAWDNLQHHLKKTGSVVVVRVMDDFLRDALNTPTP